MQKKIKAVIIGAKWFDKVNGNTYNNAKIILIGKDETETVYKGFGYGYGSQYYYDAVKYVESNYPNCDVTFIDGGSFYVTKKEAVKGWF